MAAAVIVVLVIGGFVGYIVYKDRHEKDVEGANGESNTSFTPPSIKKSKIT